jgi:uncharacterized protein (DUF1778 family)
VAPKTERIGLRATPEQRSLLEAASRTEGMSVTEFVLEHATSAAENVLADRRVFALGEEKWAEFVRLLDRPAREVPGLRELMTSPSVLDEEE